MPGILGLALLAAMISSAAGCVVRERVVARPGACPGGVWIEGHGDRHGRWHRAHWRCPGVVDRIEIE